jgi:hypothetical protein
MTGQFFSVIVTIGFVALGAFGLLRAWQEAKAGRRSLAALLAILGSAVLTTSLLCLAIILGWLFGPYGALG